MLASSFVVQAVRRCFLFELREIERASCPWPCLIKVKSNSTLDLVYARLCARWASLGELGRRGAAWEGESKLLRPARLHPQRPLLSSPRPLARHASSRFCFIDINRSKCLSVCLVCMYVWISLSVMVNRPFPFRVTNQQWKLLVTYTLSIYLENS